jgi:hypothetical protein
MAGDSSGAAAVAFTSGSSSTSSWSRREPLLLADDEQSSSSPLLPGSVCRDASEKIDNIGEKMALPLAKTGLDGEMCTDDGGGPLSGRTWMLTAFETSGGGTYLRISRDMATIVKADNVPTLTMPESWSTLIENAMSAATNPVIKVLLTGTAVTG